MPVCPRTGDAITHVGTHVLIDLREACPVRLADPVYIRAACEEAALATGATILASRFHHFGEESGVSGVVLLSESHLSIHTWPEYSLATLDVFTCGDHCDPELAVPVLKERFSAGIVKVSVHERGHV